MNELTKVEGRCLCGGVTVKAEVAPVFDACHCGMCRRWGGGPLLAVHAGAETEFTGGDLISSYTSSDWAERGFCKRCGTHLYYRMTHDGQYILPLGLLDEGFEPHFNEQIFVDRKPGCYSFANETANLTEAEVFAKYAPTGGSHD